MSNTEERLSKLLSAHGLCSRRAAEELIRCGKVTVNGEIAALGQKADAAADEIVVDGKPLREKSEGCYLMLHKPRGYITTVSDERGRKTVMDLLQGCDTRVWPVGRLDMDSEGLLLMTNDGALTNRLIHPRHEIKKTYLVWVQGDAVAAVPVLRQMTQLEGEPIFRPEVCLKKTQKNGGLLSIVIHEGKNRQVRRMCAAAGLKVTRLKRVAEGSLTLGSLPLGRWRPLTKEEIARLNEE